MQPSFMFVSVLRTLTGHKAGIKSLDFHPYGEYVASGSMDCSVKVSQVSSDCSFSVSFFLFYNFCLFSFVFVSGLITLKKNDYVS